MEQQEFLLGRCFASEAPQNTPTVLAKALEPRQIPASEDVAANARRLAALLPGVLGRIIAGTNVPDSLYSQFDFPLDEAIREFGEAGIPFLVGRDSTERHSPEDIVWTCLCVSSIASRCPEKILELELILLSCLKDGGPKAAAQLVAAFADPNPQSAFAAIFCAGWALADPALAEALLAAGVATALVAAIRHAKSFCRDAALVSACRGARSPNPKVLQELRRAGLARALMRVVRHDVPKDPEEGAETMVPISFAILLPIWGGEHDPAPRVVSNSSRTACAAAVELIAVAPDFAVEVAECLVSTQGPLGIFEYAAHRDPHPPAHLVSSILAALQEGSVKKAFITHLLGGMRTDNVAVMFMHFMSPKYPLVFMTRNALLEFDKVFDALQGCERWTLESAGTVGIGLVDYIKETRYVGSSKDDPLVDVAVRMLSKLRAPAGKDRRAVLAVLVNKDPRKLVGSLARVMASDDAALAFRASLLVLDCVRVKMVDYNEHTKESEGLMRAAVKAGYIPHLLRLLQMPPSAWALADSHHSVPLDFAAGLAVAVLQVAVSELLLCKNFSYVEEAVQRGLLDMIKAAMCGSNASEVEFGFVTLRLLLYWEEETLPWLRNAGLWPEAVVEVVERAGSSDSEIVKAAARLAYSLTTKSRWAKALGSLLAAGFLTKLRAALARVSSGPEVTGERVLTTVGRYILALEAWADSNWKSIAQFMPLGTGTAPVSSKKPKKDLKKLVLKHVLEPEEAGALALVNPQPRGARPQSTQPVTATPSADCLANGRVPGGTAAAAETGIARQGSPGQASALTAPSSGPSRESGGRDASVANSSMAGGPREPQPGEDRERESGSCEEVPHTERQGVPTLPSPGHKKAADACVQCGAVKGVDCTMLLECAACRPVRYCGRECQRGHWRVHKPACIAMQEEPD